MKSTATLHEAALESARIFNSAVAECAASAGLLAVLKDPKTAADVVRQMDFLPERQAQVEKLLRVLVDAGAVRAVPGDRATTYRASTTDIELGQLFRVNHNCLRHWFGEQHVRLIRDANRNFIGRELDVFRSTSTAIRFDREHLDSWRVNLSNPLYEFGRLRCVRALVERGNRFLDLACGLGYGAQRLAEFSSTPCSIVGIDKSRDFLDVAATLIYPNAVTTFYHHDLNQGLPAFEPSSFDGILFNGAFHFISDKQQCLEEMYRVLRPGGVLALGHCFSDCHFSDASMHQFYFSLMEDPAYPMAWPDLKTLVRRQGFALLEEFDRGSHGYLLLERLQFVSSHHTERASAR